jgi:hypothetical protein
MSDGWNPPEEERMAYLAGRALEPAFADLKAKLPEGTDFGILIIVPNSADPRGEGRVIAMTTDRKRLGLAAAQWILNAEPFGGGERR